MYECKKKKKSSHASDVYFVKHAYASYVYVPLSCCYECIVQTYKPNVLINLRCLTIGAA